MDLLFWHHDATGFLALTIVAWGLMVVSAIIAARIEEAEASAARRALPTRAPLTHELGELSQPLAVSLSVA